MGVRHSRFSISAFADTWHSLWLLTGMVTIAVIVGFLACGPLGLAAMMKAVLTKVPAQTSLGRDSRLADCDGDTDTSSWEVYTSSRYRYSIRYPERVSIKVSQPARFPEVETVIFYSEEATPGALMPDDPKKAKCFNDNYLFVPLSVVRRSTDEPSLLSVEKFFDQFVAMKPPYASFNSWPAMRPYDNGIIHGFVYPGDEIDGSPRRVFFIHGEWLFVFAVDGAGGTGSRPSTRTKEVFERMLGTFQLD